jgi:acetyl-CoA acyltransferase
MQTDDCAVTGVSLTAFGKYLDRSLRELAAEAIAGALSDAHLEPNEIDMAFVASTAGSVISGQVAVVGQVVLNGTGVAGIPVYNVDNACAGSSTALNLATPAIAGGAASRVLVVGVEKLFAEDRALTFRAINGAADIEWIRSTGVDIDRDSVFMKEVYPERLREYPARWPLSAEALAKIAVKNRGHARFNDKAQYRDPLTIDAVLEARVVQAPIRALMCSPIADGAAAAVVVAGDLARQDDRAVWIRASRASMGSPPPRAESTISRVARQAYQAAPMEPRDIDVAEVHDATALSELLAYEELGLCPPGQGTALVEAGGTSIGGRIPVNPSGGLESRGHPLAATGLGTDSRTGRPAAWRRRQAPGRRRPRRPRRDGRRIRRRRLGGSCSNHPGDHST